MSLEIIAGVDEVGRGPLAGPVVAAAVILTRPINGLGDSKTISAKGRVELNEQIRRDTIWALGAASVDEIDRLNIRSATLLAMRRAISRLPQRPTLVLVDGNADPMCGLPTRCIVKGDRDVPAIGAASIIAKVCRDRLMVRLAARYPGFGWERNAGYGTAEHRAAIAQQGPVPHHRRSFAPIKAMAANR